MIIPTRVVYVDYQKREHSTEELALKSNRELKQRLVEDEIVRKIIERLNQVDIFKYRQGHQWQERFTIEDIARYLMTTDCVKMAEKINQITIDAIAEVERVHPKIPV